LFGGEKPRIVGIEEVPIEAELSAHMLFIRNEDKPGFIGKLGTALGNDGINIATFHLGRTAPGAQAIALVSVDQPVADGLLERIRAVPGVVRATSLRF
jgi:D-3-phosphoglycerate dehydrogenase